jgi:RNA polymerase subunit RPABC4/transcription elongation factor Spt4
VDKTTEECIKNNLKEISKSSPPLSKPYDELCKEVYKPKSVKEATGLVLEWLRADKWHNRTAKRCPNRCKRGGRYIMPKEYSACPVCGEKLLLTGVKSGGRWVVVDPDTRDYMFLEEYIVNSKEDVDSGNAQR